MYLENVYNFVVNNLKLLLSNGCEIVLLYYLLPKLFLLCKITHFLLIKIPSLLKKHIFIKWPHMHMHFNYYFNCIIKKLYCKP